jgi:hypothetical protein
MNLFWRKKRTQIQKTNPGAYYKHVYLSESNYKALEFVAKCNRISRVKMANLLFERGLRSFLGEAVGLDMQNKAEAEENMQIRKVSRTVRMLRALAKSQGQDISKYI